MTNKLIPILTDLTRRPVRDKRDLERGLTLAYTPGPLNDSRFRLTLSRLQKYPSEQEIEIVKAALQDSLRKQKRPYDQMIVESGLKKGKRFYHVIGWREPVQEAIF